MESSLRARRAEVLLRTLRISFFLYLCLSPFTNAVLDEQLFDIRLLNCFDVILYDKLTVAAKWRSDII
ncbi:hypothetical protein T4D_13863 [Trichinella pseudospiralis]|uniref:Uncharacterized protein n=1 Tax=Trichinella pseudospiralis TaxID=6337 RepID=A0A0V1G4S2_TRIPS|nr:hypothetical protein T4D_13863 [Trichinella pseudospiralis]